jgi:hypothetical protein
MNLQTMSDQQVSQTVSKWGKRKRSAERKLPTAPERLVDHLYDVIADADREISAAQRELARRGHGW